MKRAWIVTVFVVAASQSVHGAQLLGCDFTGILYDVNPTTAVLSNPRSTGIPGLSGITFSPNNGKLYGLRANLAGIGSLYEINPTTGASLLVGPTGFGVVEGDLDFDPTTGTLYGMYTLGGFFTMDPATGAGAIAGPVASLDSSAMAFDNAGSLYMLDGTLGTLSRVNKANGQVLSSVALSQMNLGTVQGMDFDPSTGKLLVGSGFPTAMGTPSTLFSLNPTTGVLTAIGPFGTFNGVSGLEFFPGLAAVPTLSEWGLVLLTVMLMTAGVVSLRRAKTPAHR